jgi:hypothetical protein
VTADELAELVAARMERQSVLSGSKPPRLWVVIDEAVLHRQVGSDKIMHDQLLHLADMSERPYVTIEVVPFSAGAHSGLLGACAIADIDGGSPTVYLETLSEGFVVDTPSAVSGVKLTFDTLRAEALPRGASRNLIMKQAESYESD